MRIAELYRSVQGEGRLTGVDSVFVRTSGCNLRCWFCDTPYASWTPEGDDLSVDEITERIVALEATHVVLTGGEPMLFAELMPLCERLRGVGRHITIETAGTLYQSLACDLMSISPKFASSAPPSAEHPRWHARHERSRHQPEVMRRLLGDYDCQLKFVIDQPSDLAELSHYLADFPQLRREQVLLMPQGVTLADLESRRGWLEAYCAAEGFQFCPRKQIEWFGLQRGT
ncbi:MAG: 7-carboxy-7-deazaguanine synthase QueE [Planctomycetaceae bacterium]|nr:7-carboxy-7-deazaguanine synthase QueE [Planctomycetaceae bacterium]